MGHFVSIHLMQSAPSLERARSALPASIGCRAYRHSRLSLFAVDTYPASKPPRSPFLALTPATDLPLDLPQTLSDLNQIYIRLQSEGKANGLKRAYISLSTLLSRALDQRVLSIVADDEGNDFACLTQNGALASLVARCDDYLVRRPSGATAVLEDADTESLVLHQLASRHLQESFGVAGADLGLGSFNAPSAYGFSELATGS